MYSVSFYVDPSQPSILYYNSDGASRVMFLKMLEFDLTTVLQS